MFNFLTTNESGKNCSYLSHKVSNERNIRVEFLQTPADVTNYRQDVATAQQVNHPVQQSLLQLQLIEGWRVGCETRNMQSAESEMMATTCGNLANTHLLHYVQLRVLGLKEFDEQLQHLWVQQLVTRGDLCREGEGEGEGG